MTVPILLITCIVGVALFCSIKLYSGPDGRIPAAGTDLGKRARMVVGTIFVCYTALLALNILGSSDATVAISWVGTLIIGASVPFFRYVRFKGGPRK
jgi:hypothetical protein